MIICPKCGKEFKRHGHLLQHDADKHDELPEIRPFPCLFCNRRFTTQEGCETHMRIKHQRSYRLPEAEQQARALRRDHARRLQGAQPTAVEQGIPEND